MTPHRSIHNYLLLILFSIAIQAKDEDKPMAYSELPSQYYQKFILSNFNNDNDKITFYGLKNGNQDFSIQQKSIYQNGDLSIQAKSEGSNAWINATIGKNSIFGEMHENNKHHIITTDANGSWLIELPKDGLIYNSCPLNHEQPESQKVSHNSTQKNNSNEGTSNVIDFYMMYDQAIEDRYPGELLETRLNQYFNVANQSLFNSNIDLKVRLVGFEKTNYNSSNSNEIARNNIRAALAGAPVNGLNNLLQRRQQLGADMVVLIRPHNIQTRGNCGIAYFPVTTDNGNSFDDTYGVHVMSDGMSSWSICTDQLMIHELGHNLGATHHNDPNDYLPGGGGYAKIGKFSTIMGSFGTGQPERFFEIDAFSNPNIQCAGVPCGVANQSNNANVASQLVPFVANYQPSISNLPLSNIKTPSNPDSDGDGLSDWDDEFPFDKNETSDLDDDGVGDNSDAFPTNASEQYDTDNDGIGNNADNDDDGDGVNDNSDYFPLDENEVSDSDIDGMGDNADAFPNNIFEQVDNDNDSIGDNQDLDDDNDGFDDTDNIAQDILVINTGSNQILRFDAQTGQPKGIELTADDGLLTFQSDLSYREGEQVLYYTSSSSVKRLDLSNRNPLDLAIPPYFRDDFYPRLSIYLNSGFPTSLTNIQGTSEIVLSTLRSTQPIRFKGSFPTLRNGSYILENNENILDIVNDNSDIYFLDQSSSIYKGQITDTNIQKLGGNNSWMSNQFAMQKTQDNRLLISNQNTNHIGTIDANSGAYLGIFAKISDYGYTNPTGMAITNENILLVAANDQNSILKFDISNGEFLGLLVADKGLNDPYKMIVVPKLVDRFHNEDDKVIRPNAGLWFNQAKNGRGFDIQIFNNRLSVIWYTFDESGLPIWYISSGELNGFQYEGEFLKTHLNTDNSVSTEIVGSISIDFNDERNAEVNWQINNNQGSESIDWLTWSNQAETENYTGLWGRPDGPGWGVSVATIGPTSVAIPYIYDSSGEPRWLISNPIDTLTPLSFSLNSVYSNTLCPGCTGDPSFTMDPSGTMTLDLSENKSWDSNILFNAPLNGDWILDDTDLILFSLPATRPR